MSAKLSLSSLLAVALSIAATAPMAQAYSDRGDGPAAHATYIQNKGTMPANHRQVGERAHNEQPTGSVAPMRWIDDPASPGG